MVAELSMIQLRVLVELNMKSLSKTLETLLLLWREPHFGRRGGLVENGNLDDLNSADLAIVENQRGSLRYLRRRNAPRQLLSFLLGSASANFLHGKEISI